MSQYITAAAAARKGMTPGSFTVEEMIEVLPADGSETTIWEWIGRTTRGENTYCKSTVRVGGAGIEVIAKHVEDKGEWRVVLVHPVGQSRMIKTLARK